MTNNSFELVQSVIKSRRSTGSGKMNGAKIDNETVSNILALADWAPTHGRTEPWRFYVYTGEALKEFGETHARLYWENTAEEKRLEATRDKLLHNGDKASHLMIAVMKRGENVKIPQVEEIAATAAAIQNVLLGATALGINSFWSTGGLTHSNVLKEYLQLGSEDVVMGLIYLGYTDEPSKEGARNIALAEKIKWM